MIRVIFTNGRSGDPAQSDGDVGADNHLLDFVARSEFRVQRSSDQTGKCDNILRMKYRNIVAGEKRSILRQTWTALRFNVAVPSRQSQSLGLILHSPALVKLTAKISPKRNPAKNFVAAILKFDRQLKRSFVFVKV